MSKITVYEVLYDGPGEGPAGDGTHFWRGLDRAEAEDFARERTCYERPAQVQTARVPRRAAQRWGLV